MGMRLAVVVVARVEVEVVYGAQRQGRWVDGARVSCWSAPVLNLHVDFDCQLVSEVIVWADTGGRKRSWWN
jgi:hypothetical protein